MKSPPSPSPGPKKVHWADKLTDMPRRTWNAPTLDQMDRRNTALFLSQHAEKLQQENAIAKEQEEAIYHARRALDRESRSLYSLTAPVASSSAMSMTGIPGIGGDTVTSTVNLLQQLSILRLEQERYMLSNETADLREQRRLQEVQLERDQEERKWQRWEHERDTRILERERELTEATRMRQDRRARERSSLTDALDDLRRELHQARPQPLQVPVLYYSSPPMFSSPGSSSYHRSRRR